MKILPFLVPSTALLLLLAGCSHESTSGSSQPLEPLASAPQVAFTDQNETTSQPPPAPSLSCRAESARLAILTIFAGTEIGTGSLVSSNGLVLTNEHVVREVGYGEIHARLWGGRRYKGQVLAVDRAHDLALVQLKSQEQFADTIAFANPETIQNGQAVCALGSPRAITGVLAQGKLLGIRGASDLKAAILLQPGNSGGPLLNAYGEMIGVNKSIWLSDTGQNAGVGFATNMMIANQFFERHQAKALPAESFAAEALPQSNSEASTPASPGYLGVILDNKTLVIQIVEPNSPAEKAGLNAGDRLLAVDRRPIQQFAELKALLDQQPQQAVFTVMRDTSAWRESTSRDLIVTF